MDAYTKAVEGELADMVTQEVMVPLEIVFMRRVRLAIVVEVAEVGFL